MDGLMIHAGAHRVERATVCAVPTPLPTRTHYPIPHEYMIEKVLAWIASDQMTIVAERHALGHDGANYFGVFSVQRDGVQSDHALAVGVRNSHDKTYPAGLAVGSNVFVCDNLAFSAEIVVSRRHTARILDSMDRLLAEAFGRFGELYQRQSYRLDTYKSIALVDRDAHDLVVRAVDAEVMPPSQMMPVLRGWRHPQHEDFRPRTVWSLFNSFTEAAKGWPVMDLPGRTRRLHALMDNFVGIPPTQGELS